VTIREAVGWILLSGLGLAFLTSFFFTVRDAIVGEEMARTALVVIAILTAPIWFGGLIVWCFSG
jgi:hypothetical protein